MDLVFFAANTTKLFEGGWFPLLIAVSVASLMLTWRKGQQLVQQARAHLRMPLKDFLKRLEVDPPIRIPGTAVVLSATPTGVPSTLLHHLRHNRVLHERVFLVSVQVSDVPTVPDEDRLRLDAVGAGIQRLIMRIGFTEEPNVPEGLRAAATQYQIRELDPETLTYYVGRQTVVADPGSTRHGVLAGDRVFHAQSELRTDRGLLLHSSVPGRRDRQHD